jgi:hypothetical protein
MLVGLNAQYSLSCGRVLSEFKGLQAAIMQISLKTAPSLGLSEK